MRTPLHIRGSERPSSDQLDEVVRVALSEDLGNGDLTSELTLPPRSEGEAIILAREEGRMAGMPAVERVFLYVDPKIVVTPLVEDGNAFRSGQILAEVAGPTAGILSGERVALNLLQHLCGIATLAARFLQELEGTGVRLLDTRKTTPGLRVLEKYAVRMGGGTNHRMGLYDGVLIKENHIQAAGGVAEALQRARSGLTGAGPRYLVTVEAGTLPQVSEAVEAGADRILLDNMEAGEMKAAVALIRERAGERIEVEASGGINLKNVRAAASSGVDCVSVGALTHSVRALDISLLLK